MRIVSSNSQEDLARHRDTAEVSWALRDLASNLMRIIRGAGKPYDVIRQTTALVEAMVQYRETVGALPASEEIASMLSIDRDQEHPSQVLAEHADRMDAERLIVQGALQVAASRLIGQKTHESSGYSEMSDGCRALERARKAERVARMHAPEDRAGARRPREPGAS